MEEKKPTSEEASLDTNMTTEVTQMDGDIVADKEVVTTTEASEESAIKSCIKKNGKIILTIVILSVLVALVWAFYQQQSTGTMDDGMAMAGDVSFDEVPATVARINGMELTKEDYIEVYQQSWQAAVQQGADTTDPLVLSSIATQAMDVLVNTELLAQAADTAGVSVTDDEISNEIDLLEAQMGGSEGLQTALAASGMDMAQLEENMAMQMQIEAYLDTTLELTASVVVSDTEVKARYDEVAALSQEALPAYEEVADVIRAQLESEADQEAVSAVLERLRNEGEVEVLYVPAA